MTYPLKEAEANGIINAVNRGFLRMIAAEDLLDLIDSSEAFEDRLERILDNSPEEWLTAHYELLSATHTALRALVDDTRDGLEMTETWKIDAFFSEARMKRVRGGGSRMTSRDRTDPNTLSAELNGVSCLVCALYAPFSEDEVTLTNETIAEALFAIECYLERISEDVGELPAGKEVRA